MTAPKAGLSFSGKRFLLAIHDVTPAHRASLERVYRLLEQLGLTRYALLVVPDWHGEWPLDRHAAFVDDLLKRHAAGAEVFLHGYRHDETGFRRTWMQSASIAGRTAASAEFYVAPPGETARRLDRGLTLFATLGLEPVGFIPPAWIHHPGLADQLQQRNLSLTEGFWRITNLSSGRRKFAPALSWSTARPWRSHVTARMAALRGVLERARGLVRVAIHPPDIEVGVVAAQLRLTIEALGASRRAATYGEVMRSS